MKRKILINISFGIIILVLLIRVILSVYIEPWIGKRIETVLNEKNKEYTVKVGAVRILIYNSSIELKKINIQSRESSKSDQFFLKGEIASIQFKGISLVKALIKKDIDISKVTISACNISATVPFPRHSLTSITSSFNIRIGSILFDKTNLAIKNSLDAQYFLVSEGVLKLYDLNVLKQDTLSSSIVKQFDFEAKECTSVSSDSLYSYKIIGVKYSTTSNTLGVDTVSIHPNFKDYDFTSRFKYQTNRFEATFCNIYAYDFNAANYLKSKSMICSYIKVGNMELNIFRDKRKLFNHVKKVTFQDAIYNYHSIVNIDSFCLLNGNITYTVHAKMANQPGTMSFNEIHARILKITNEPIYKTKSAFFELETDALLMGKSKLSVLLKSKLFDNQNTFTVNGTLSGIDIKDLNPILEKTAFLYAFGKIDAMNFNFKANNTKALGQVIMLYHGLNITLKNKRTDNTTDFAEKFISKIANKILLDSNPIPGEGVRDGIIDYERDPERFVSSYCFKSILTGVEYSLVNNPKKKRIHN